MGSNSALNGPSALTRAFRDPAGPTRGWYFAKDVPSLGVAQFIELAEDFVVSPRLLF
jgi:hypothetical protein